jgi:hypothetical protein
VHASLITEPERKFRGAKQNFIISNEVFNIAVARYKYIVVNYATILKMIMMHACPP